MNLAWIALPAALLVTDPGFGMNGTQEICLGPDESVVVSLLTEVHRPRAGDDDGCELVQPRFPAIVSIDRGAPGAHHVIFVGRPVAITIDEEASPLIFYRGRYRGVAP